VTHILLLGAGFSRNWGGLLADEFFDSLVGAPEAREDKIIRDLLWKYKGNGGFEHALSELQTAYTREPAKFEDSLKHMQTAILRTLELMNEMFLQRTGIEFQQHRERMLRTFFFKFDAIFTLNQDVLLEHHYCRRGDLVDAANWLGAQLPGMKRIPSEEYPHDPSWGRDLWVPRAPAEFLVESNSQPIFKLHGSANWRDKEDGPLLVIGGDKTHEIESHEVLSWYFRNFREYMLRPNSKLFVIGYGFKDLHVNELIIDSVMNHGLEFFVLDKFGSDVVKHANPSFGGAIYAPNALDEAFEQGLLGASSRNLSETFGDDSVSHATVMRFLG